jgi:hypothetical protein
MKRFYLLLILCLLSQPVWAKTIPVQAMNNLSTENPPSTYSVRILDEITLDKDLVLKVDDIVHGEIVDVKDPKRLKRDATFTFIPKSITSTNGQVVKISNSYLAKYTTQIDKAQLAQTIALGVGSYFVKGLSIGVNAVEGMVKNEQDNRLKSGLVSAYEGSPLSYVQKGQEIEILKEQVFFLNFQVNNEMYDEPNYEYTKLD